MDATAFGAWLMDPREPKVCGSIDAFGAQKAAVQQLCAQTKNCVYLVPDPSPSPSPMADLEPL